MTRVPPGETVYIVGSGPTLAGFDYGSLRGRFVIALNNAAALLPFARVVFFGNESWYRANERLVLDHVGEIHRIRFGVAAPPLGVPKIRESLSSGRVGLDLTEGYLRTGLTCGYSSVNLAVQMGAKRITLLGFDFVPGGNPARPCPDHEQALYASAFDYLVGPLKVLGVEVFNASASSIISAFPKAKKNPASLFDSGVFVRDDC